MSSRNETITMFSTAAAAIIAALSAGISAYQTHLSYLSITAADQHRTAETLIGAVWDTCSFLQKTFEDEGILDGIHTPAPDADDGGKNILLDMNKVPGLKQPNFHILEQDYDVKRFNVLKSEQLFALWLPASEKGAFAPVAAYLNDQIILPRMKTRDDWGGYLARERYDCHRAASYVVDWMSDHNATHDSPSSANILATDP